ncbi:MAG TPA: ABC transporter permease [Candidatus Angelobacter sp.]|nr:ABC transporter permease [Candidatus Angelobacter sp.]
MQANPKIRGLMWQCTVLLRTASLLVPKPERARWYKEWYGETWHWLHFLAESDRLNTHSVLDLLRHCWGAFPDAAWHRFDQKKTVRAFEEVPRSARFCLGVIGFAFVFLVLITGLAPTIRAGFRSLPFQQPDRLAYLSFQSNFAQYDEEYLFRNVGEWGQSSKSAESAAAYSWRPAALVTPDGVVRRNSARVSPNMFALLGNKAARGRLFTAGDTAACPHCVVISHELWSDEFRSDHSIVGKTITLDDHPKTVIGVLPENFVFIYPEVSVWELPHWGFTTHNLAWRTGAVLRMKPHVSMAQTNDEFRGFARKEGYDRTQLESFNSRAHQGAKLYLFFSVLSLFGGIALGSSRLGGAKTRKIKLSFSHTARWWGFFLGKTLLLLAICFVGALEITGRVSIMMTGSVHPLVGPFSTWLFLVTAMIALSWSLHDQSRRCRLCLKRLGNEASVGMPGYLFLGWWGTELVCSDGHGMLHVPEMKSSWQEFDQWVSLDESWKPLFETKEPVHAP